MSLDTRCGCPEAVDKGAHTTDHEALVPGRARVAGYIRVSGDEQRKDRTDEAQTYALAQWAAREGCDLRLYKDLGITGERVFRERPGSVDLSGVTWPGGAALWAAVERDEVDMIVCVEMDRMFRATDVSDSSRTRMQLTDCKVKLYTLSQGLMVGPGIDPLTGDTFTSMSAAEKRNMLKRFRRGAYRATREGKWLGPTPLGYRKATNPAEPTRAAPLVEDPETAWVVRQIFTWRVEDRLIDPEAARRLNAMGAPMRSHEPRGAKKVGKKGRLADHWRPARVQEIASDPVYTGRPRPYGLRNNSKVLTDARREARKAGEPPPPPPRRKAGWDDEFPEPIARTAPALVSAEVFEMAQLVAVQHRRFGRGPILPADGVIVVMPGERHPPRSYLLAGMLKCGICGRAFSGASKDDDLPRYICLGTMAHKRGDAEEKCPSAAILWHLDRQLWDDLRNLFLKERAMIVEAVERYLDTERGRLDQLHADRARVEQEITKLREKRKRVISKYGDGDDADADEVMADTDARLANAAAELRRIASVSVEPAVVLGQTERFLQQIAAAVEDPSPPFETKRRILEVLVESATVQTVFQEMAIRLRSRTRIHDRFAVVIVKFKLGTDFVHYYDITQSDALDRHARGNRFGLAAPRGPADPQVVAEGITRLLPGVSTRPLG